VLVGVLPPAVQANLALVARTALAEQFYLAGGTAVSYFEDAEPEPMPQMLVPCRWQDVKRFFEGEVRRLMEELLR